MKYPFFFFFNFYWTFKIFIRFTTIESIVIQSGVIMHTLNTKVIFDGYGIYLCVVYIFI